MRIDGNKICIRDWIIEDLQGYEHWNQPGHKWQDYDGPYYPRPNEEQITVRCSELKETILKLNFPTLRKNLAIADIKNNNLIGQVSWYWQSKETNWLSIGICIYDSNYWRTGIGYEALGLWSEYLFQEMPSIARLDIRTWSGNIGMMKLSEKLGYKKEACFRKARIVNGEYYDSIGYGILREEWMKLYPNGFIQKEN